MISIYSNLLGQEMPDENSGFWTRLKTIMWKGEFLGLLSEFLSPYHDSHTEAALNMVEPAAYRNITDGLTMMSDVWGEKAFFFGKDQALNTFVKNSWQTWGGTAKAWDNKVNKFYKRSKEFGKMYSQFDDEVYKKPDAEYEKTTRSPYYKHLRTVFMTGTPEEFTKTYFATSMAVAHSFLRDRKAFSIDEAFKKAQREIEKQIKAMNPNRASFLKQTKDKRKPEMWLLWLSKHPRAKEIMPELRKLEADYIKKVKLIQSQMPYHARKLNVTNMFTQYNWKMPPIR